MIFISYPRNAGDSATGDQQLVVSMEFNGVLYEGVLFANQATPVAAATTPIKNSTTPSIQITPGTPSANVVNAIDRSVAAHQLVSS